MFGCLRRAGAGVILLVLLAGAWYFRSDLVGLWQRFASRNEPATASPALAEHAEEKLLELHDEDGSGRVALTEPELQSLLRYRLASGLPAYVLSPTVRLGDGRVRVEARVPMDQVRGLPGVPGSGEIVDMLPDTTDVEARGHLIPLSEGRVALSVDEVSAAKIPLPERVIPALLRQMGRVDEPGLPETALAVSLPPGAARAYVHQDSLVFLSRRAAARAAD